MLIVVIIAKSQSARTPLPCATCSSHSDLLLFACHVPLLHRRRRRRPRAPDCDHQGPFLVVWEYGGRGLERGAGRERCGLFKPRLPLVARRWTAPSFARWRARAKDIHLLHEIKDMIGKGKPPREGCQGHQKPCLPVAFPWPPQAMQEWRRGRSRTSHASLVGSSPSVRMPSRSCKKSLRRQMPRTFPTP